ncbi:hypothetical protein ACS15_4250 [Ralstonia insidiosa]|uniref:Uncharacterized protein n=1 Tax=Ralstonia insidiosa TaxID=190721 RepID=A0AAC9BKL0_9RALS|nr:hypothetical protein ACS15_4250 [Ralstonia insidiosa]
MVRRCPQRRWAPRALTSGIRATAFDNRTIMRTYRTFLGLSP